MQRKKQVFGQAGIWIFRNLNMAIVVIPAGHCNFSNTFRALAQKKAWAYFSTFWQETFLHRHFIDIYISARGHFDSMDYLARELFCTRLFGTGTFQHLDILAWGPFDTGTFQHWNILAHGYFGKVTHFCTGAQKVCSSLSILLCMVPKFPSAKMSMSG